MLAYLAMLLMAPGLDAVIEAQTGQNAAHVEAESDVACSLGHDAYCQLCRLIDLSGASPYRARVNNREMGRHFNFDVISHRPIQSAAPVPQQPRAPPVV